MVLKRGVLSLIGVPLSKVVSSKYDILLLISLFKLESSGNMVIPKNSMNSAQAETTQVFLEGEKSHE